MDKTTYRLFLFILVFAPLAFGTTEAWSQAIVSGLCLFLILIHLRNSLHSKAPLYNPPGILPLLILAGYILFQLLPMPPGFLKVISPKTWELYNETIWLIRPETWMPLSITPKASLGEFLKLVSYAAFYFLTIQLLADRKLLKKTITFLALFASTFSLIGIFQFLFPNDRILWIIRSWPPETSRHFATYVNNNHYAGLMGMILPLVLAIFLATKPQVSYGSLREKVVEFFNHPLSNLHILTGLSSALIATSIFLTLSRGGILSTLASLLFLSLMLIIGIGKRHKGGRLFFFFIALLFMVGLFGWEPIFERFEQIRDNNNEIADQRLVYWKDSRNIISEFPITGTGFGTFIDIYPRYKTAETGAAMVGHAHNDYIEMLTDGGLLGALLAGWFLFAIFWDSYRAWRKRRNHTSIYLYMGGVAGLIAILLHSITDFNLHIGANGLYFFFLAGLTVAASHSRSRPGGGKSDLQQIPSGKFRWSFTPVTMLLIVTVIVNGGEFLANVKFANIEDIELEQLESEEKVKNIMDTARGASRLDPLNGRYKYALANINMAFGHPEAALEHYAFALRLEPQSGEYLQQVGLVYDYLGEKALAGKLLPAGVACDIATSERHRIYAEWLLSKGEIEKGLKHIQQAIFWEPQRTAECLTLMALYGLRDEQMRGGIPGESTPFLVYGDYLIERGKEPEAEECYRLACNYTAQEQTSDPAPFWRLFKYYFERERYDEALETTRMGIKLFPDSAGFHRNAARIYERTGITYRAIEEYRKSLLLDPRSKWARNRLEQLEKPL